MVGWLTFVSIVELAVLLALPTLFVVLYHRRTGGHWREFAEARHLMWFTAVLAVTFGMTLLFQLLGVFVPAWGSATVNILGHEVTWLLVGLWAQVIVFGGLILELANRLRLMLQGNHLHPDPDG